MKTQSFFLVIVGTCLGVLPFTVQCHPKEDQVSTDAGRLTLPNMNIIKHNGIYHQIRHLHSDNRAIDLENGTRWTISNSDVVKGWGASKNLVITQNHSGFSTSKFALLNLDLKQAEPINLVREPTPSKDNFYIKNVDRVNDIITLSDGKNWIVHAGDRSKLSKISENDRMLIGVNTGADKEKSPYLLIDTANHYYFRAHIIE